MQAAPASQTLNIAKLLTSSREMFDVGKWQKLGANLSRGERKYFKFTHFPELKCSKC
jgi:hypothetical protein